MTYPQLVNLSMNQTLARSINTSAVAILPVLAVLLIGAQILGATTLQSYGLALFVGLLSGAYSSIFIASPVLCMMKEREERWVAIANRLAKRGDTQTWYSAVDAATMSAQMSMAAAGQVSRAGGAGGAPAAQRSGGGKRSGPIRPGSASRPSSGGTGSGSGTGTAVMDRPPGGTAGADGGAGTPGTAARPGGPAPRPRKNRGKRRR
jgi:preprotein translocase subunit SecF